MVNESKKEDSRYWQKWKESGAIGNINNPNYGKAYAFFNSKAPRDVLPLVIEDAREMYQTPNQLELTLTEGVCKFIGQRVLGREFLEGKPVDTQLRDIAIKAKESGMKYVFEAKYKGATNEQTAGELASILTGISLASKEKDETFSARIFYEDMGKYISRD